MDYENLSSYHIDFVKVILAILSTGLLACLGKLGIALIQRHKFKELRLKNGTSELIMKGYSSADELKILKQLTEKQRKKLLKP